jgi:hypothetical protein
MLNGYLERGRSIQEVFSAAGWENNNFAKGVVYYDFKRSVFTSCNAVKRGVGRQ